MSGIGQVTEEMKSEGRVEGVRASASRRQPEREQQMNSWSNHLYPASLRVFTPRLFPRFLCLASPWDFHSMVASRNIMSSLGFFS